MKTFLARPPLITIVMNIGNITAATITKKQVASRRSQVKFDDLLLLCPASCACVVCDQFSR